MSERYRYKLVPEMDPLNLAYIKIGLRGIRPIEQVYRDCFGDWRKNARRVRRLGARGEEASE